ncbi:MAG: response regulator [Ruminococcus sp.]|nr:response regulator [Ruminococcus sp.]
MEKTTLKVMICDNSAEFGVNLASHLSKKDIYAYTRKNEENIIISSIISDSPDLVITDLTLKDSDAVQLLAKLRSYLKLLPKFIIISDIHNSYIDRQLIECGAAYTLSKPCDKDEIYNVVKLITVRHLPIDCDDAELIITDLIRRLGIPAHIKGYRYLRTAILESAQNPLYLDNMTKMLYPRVAEIYETTPERVERAIRHSIDAAWNRTNKEAMCSFFGCSEENLITRPTNSEFIALATDKLELHMKKNKKNQIYV